MMKARKANSTCRITALFSSLCVALFLSGCGGGGGGGGSPHAPQEPGSGSGSQGIVLKSITFPAWTDLSGATTTPPSGAPLGQQVIFTFSGIPQCPDELVIDKPPGYAGLQIYAVLEQDYTGPDVVVDYDKQIIPARGTYERFDNMVVFTPYFPTKEIDLSVSAEKEAVPGLLPDMEYIIFVPVGTAGSIGNLTGVDKSVTNPVRFTTISGELPNLFYQNQPAMPPRVVDQYPGDGDVDVPINTVGDDLPGFPPKKEFFVEFDQPLDFSSANVEGKGLDVDGDGVDDENMFFIYPAPEYYAVLDSGTAKDPGIYSVDRRTGKETFVGVTRLAASPYTVTGLNSIVTNGAGEMMGTDGASLYSVEYRNLQYPQVCRLQKLKDFIGRTEVRGLTLAPNGSFYALDGSTGSLLSAGMDPGDETVLVELGTSLGDWKDLAVRPDGLIYALAVKDSGGPGAWTTLESIDPGTSSVTVLFSGTGDYTSCSMAGFSLLALFASQGPGVDLFDAGSMQFVAGGHYDLTGGLIQGGDPFNIHYALARLGTRASLESNTYHGARVRLEPSGILPFGERIEFLVRCGLSNISFGSLAASEGRDPAEADRIAAFTTFDYGTVVDDTLFEEFLDSKWEGEPMEENPSLPPANWNVQDVDGQPPEYKHLLATYGLGGGGTLGDFKPLGVYPTVILDTDYQSLPLFDGSTPDVKKQTVVTGGVFNFRDIVIPEGVTVIGVGSNPLILTATGRVEIAGTIDVSGARGMDDITFNSAFTPVPGGLGGPGGGRGGVSNPAKPEGFQNLTDLRSPNHGENGWGPSNRRQIGGRGGHAGAKGTDVKYQGGKTGEDPDSRGAGGGGGSFFRKGGMGYHGLGMWGADPYSPDRYFIRDPWLFNDGAPQDMPGFVLSEHVYQTQDPPGGDPGDPPFSDSDTENDFIGPGGELTHLQGGEGGGGGGTRLDSLNPATIGLAQGWWPPVDRSAYDAKGGGGGGGGGALGIYSLGEIVVKDTGSILARGGDGGGGEVIGHSNYGGGAGGGSGGAIILDSAATITVKKGALIDVSGGWPGEAKELTKYGMNALEGNPCLNPISSGGYQNYHKASFCSFSVGDGGFGGMGLVQLEVSDWKRDLDIEDWTSIAARQCIIDWYDQYNGKCDYSLSQTHCGCTSTKNCAQKYWHYKINYPSSNQPEFPMATPDPLSGEWGPLVDPDKTPTTLGPYSYGLSKWIDMGQTIYRDSVGGLPAPVFLGFRGIDTNTGVVITQNGYIPDPDPDHIDISVDAPDWNNGTPDYIPDVNEVTVLFQGADALAPGSKVPDPGTMTDWTADITDLNGKQFIRFRVCMNTAKDSQLTPSSPKPQVNFVRIRMKY